MICVALLRGINVGGNSKIEMPKLKATLESIGCLDVSTYINSGNVIFSDDRGSESLIPLIEGAIFKEFNLNIRILIRDYLNIANLCKSIPDSWTNDKEQRTDVIFLWDEINKPAIKNQIKCNPKIENVLFLDGAIVWNIGRENVTRGGGIKLIKTDLYKHMTIRNINTVRKLNKLMQKD